MMKITLREFSRGISIPPSSNNTSSSPPSGPGSKRKAMPEENIMINYLQVLDIIITCLHWSLVLILNGWCEWWEWLY